MKHIELLARMISDAANINRQFHEGNSGLSVRVDFIPMSQNSEVVVTHYFGDEIVRTDFVNFDQYCDDSYEKLHIVSKRMGAI